MGSGSARAPKGAAAGDEELQIGAAVVAAVCSLLAVVCVLVTALPQAPSRAWWVRAWDFPRQQIVVLGAIAAAGLFLARGVASGWEAALLAGLAVALGYQLAQILPYTRLWPRQGLTADGAADDARSLRLVVVNVLMTNRQVDGLGASLEEADPDVVLALEPDAWWAARLGEMLPGHTHRACTPWTTPTASRCSRGWSCSTLRSASCSRTASRP
jgi:endonuclease/exonuclease/phosphatase (EEP) superfamily protein YafD